MQVTIKIIPDHLLHINCIVKTRLKKMKVTLSKSKKVVKSWCWFNVHSMLKPFTGCRFQFCFWGDECLLCGQLSPNILIIRASNLRTFIDVLLCCSVLKWNRFSIDYLRCLCLFIFIYNIYVPGMQIPLPSVCCLYFGKDYRIFNIKINKDLHVLWSILCKFALEIV